MRRSFLHFIWAMTALIDPQTWGQTIIPIPRLGAVLWTNTMTNTQGLAALYLTADERLDILAGKLVTLSAGGMVSQPMSQSGDGCRNPAIL